MQTAGILTTSIATGYDYKNIIWIGIGLNLCASLINILAKSNQSLSRKLLSNIISIKDGNYIDEADLSEPKINNSSNIDPEK
jgi:hypothetical protein